MLINDVDELIYQYIAVKNLNKLFSSFNKTQHRKHIYAATVSVISKTTIRLRNTSSHAVA